MSKQYSTTAKLWIKINADTPEEAQTISKNVVDDALVEYFLANKGKKVLKGVASVSKAKVIWIKENIQKEETI